MKKQRLMIYSVPLLLLLFSTCGPADDSGPAPVFPDFELQYDLSAPDRTFEMPGKLEEISGLSLKADGKHLLAVQDEDGTIFEIDKKNGEVTREIDFWKDGDYEGIEAVGETVYAVKSSGTLYRIRYSEENYLAVEKFNGRLSSRNDVEGLAYDAARRRLLLACKGAAGQGEAYRFKKAVYAFDLETMTLDSLPTFLISLEDVQAYLGTSPTVRKLEKLIEYFSLDKSEFVFSPSAIAIHPRTGHLYITSSIGKLLMVLDEAGRILHIEKLKKSVHPQPEGLCFDADGTLFIANEGRGGGGVIHRFDYRGDAR